MENDLYLFLQLNKQFFRQIKLLELLNSYTNPVTIGELGRSLKCRTACVREDIRALNAQLEDDFQIVEQSFREIQLHRSEHTSIEDAIASLVKPTLSHQIVEALLNEQKLSMAEVCQNLFVSMSSFRRTVTHMNNVLQYFDLKISTKPLMLVGNEVNIRLFFFCYYVSFGDTKMVWDKDDYSELYVDILNQAKSDGFPNLHLIYFRAVLWTSVNRIRITKKHFIQLDEAVANEIKETEGYKQWNGIYDKYFINVPTYYTIPEEEMIWAYCTCLHSVAYFEPNTMVEGIKELTYHPKESPEVISEVCRFLRLMLSSEDAQVNMRDLKKISGLLINLRILSKISPLFEVATPEVIEYMKREHGEIFNRWCAGLRTLSEGGIFTFTHFEDVASYMTMLHVSFIKKKKMIVLFCFQGQPGISAYLAQNSKRVITEDMEAKYLFEHAISRKEIEATEADVLVSNYSIHQPDTMAIDWFRLSSIPTPADWESLKVFLEEKIN